MKVSRKCQHCGKEFMASPSRTGTYCSKMCHDEARRRRVHRECEYCGQLFTVLASAVASGKGRFCNLSCANKAQSQRVLKACEMCGVEFKAEAVHVRKGWGRYCSKKCADEAHKKRIECVCQQCGKLFTVSPSQMARGEGKFCSRACFQMTNVGASHPHWRGGTFYSYGLTWKSQRKLAYERDGGVCQHCGLTEKQARKKYGYRNSVHHIIKRRTFRQEGKSVEEANVLTNLLTLCFSCHKKAEAGKIVLRPKLF